MFLSRREWIGLERSQLQVAVEGFYNNLPTAPLLTGAICRHKDCRFYAGPPGRDRLPAHIVYRGPERVGLRAVRLLPRLHDARVHRRRHCRTGHRLIQDPGR